MRDRVLDMLGPEEVRQCPVVTDGRRVRARGRGADLVEHREPAVQAHRHDDHGEAAPGEGPVERDEIGGRAEEQPAERRDDRRDRGVHDDDRSFALGRALELHQRLEQRGVQRDREADRDQRQRRGEHGIEPGVAPVRRDDVDDQQHTGADEAGVEDRAVRVAVPEPRDGPRHDRRTREERARQVAERVAVGVDLLRQRGERAQHGPGREVQDRGEAERAPERGPLPDGADARPQGVRRRRPHLRGLRDREHDHEQRHVGERVHEERPSRPGRRDHDAADDRTRDRAHGRRARLQRGELGEAVVGHGHPVERRPRRRDEGGDDADGEVGAEEDRVGEVAVDDDRHQHERHHDLPGLADGTDDARVVARQPPDDRREHEGGERPGREHEDGEHQRTRVLVRDERDRDRGHRRAHGRGERGRRQVARERDLEERPAVASVPSVRHRVNCTVRP